MRKIAFVLALFSTMLLANELKTVYSYKKALKIAQDENKKVLFITTIQGCPACQYMKDIVWEREKVLDFIKDNYIVVVKDAERDSYPKKFHTRDMPTYYFIDPYDEGEIQKSVSGGMNPEKFLALIKSPFGIDEAETKTVEENNITNIEAKIERLRKQLQETK